MSIVSEVFCSCSCALEAESLVEAAGEVVSLLPVCLSEREGLSVASGAGAAGAGADVGVDDMSVL